MDFDGPASAGSMSGSGGIIVMDNSVDMVEAMTVNAFMLANHVVNALLVGEGSLWMEKSPKECVRVMPEKDMTYFFLLLIRLKVEHRAFGEALRGQLRVL